MAIGTPISPTYPTPHDPAVAGNWANLLVGTGGVLPQIVAKLNEIDAAVASLSARLGVTITVSATPPSSPAVNDIWIDIS